jgi:hypothetical protein
MAQGQIISLHVDEDNPKGLYKYQLPPLPDEKDIWYYDVPKKQQYWRTPAVSPKFKWLDQQGNLRKVQRMDERSRIEYIDYWRDKYENGLWVMINGDPTWLTGMHVEHLVINQIKNKPFLYLDSQRERFYFRDLTDKERTCDGRIWAKGRRVGITAEQITHAVRILNDDYGNHISCQSDTFPKAKSTLLDKIIDVHTKRPEWMRETYYAPQGKKPRSKLELIDGLVTGTEDEPLGGICRAFPTTAKAIDGEEFMLVIMDELSKIIDALPRELFEVNVKTIVNPGKRGKLDALSTTGDSKEAQKAVRDWHQMLADSNIKALNANGKTNTGLWPWFVSYIHSLELLENMPQIKDVYGKINKEMAEEYIWTEVKKHPKDSKQYTFALYKMPMVMRHTLLTAGGQGYFSKLRISARLEELMAMPYDKKPYVIGSLEYDSRGLVYFESNAEREVRCLNEGTEYIPGHWMIALHPYFSAERGIDTRNRYIRSADGVCFPSVNPEGIIGYDPIRYKKEDTSSNKLSEAAIIVYKKFDYYRAGDAEQFAGLYLHRPDDPRDANAECIKAAKYWGYKVAHERVIETVKEDFETAKMVPFLIVNPKDNLCGFWIDSQGKLVKNALDAMVSRFSIPKSPDVPDQIAICPFEHVLRDLDGVDLTNTTMYDVFMAMVEMETGLPLVPFTNLTDATIFQDNKLQLMQEIIPPRNN